MNLGLLLLRLTVGLTIAAHGSQKLFGWFSGPGLSGTGQFFTMLGFPPGRRHASMAGLSETVGGLLLALGLLTPLAAAAKIAVMIVAVFSVHLPIVFRTFGMISRTFTCPIVYEVMEDLKRSLGFLRTDFQPTIKRVRR
jgi:uncharacterized membrane protein YphA (DoxX/SURF4 family)